MRPMSANKRPIETRTHLNWFRCCPPRVGQNQSSTHHVIQKHLRATFTDKKKIIALYLFLCIRCLLELKTFLPESKC